MARKRLDVLLVERGLIDSRARARAAIEAGKVTVDGRVAAKPGELTAATAAIAAEPAHPWVSRAALKLVHALELWPVATEGRTVLDVGASTGGFTEVCLARGAARVFAVDVGRGQLHPSLMADPRVVSLEAADARKLDRDLITDPVGLIVCDASFIGLGKVLPAALALAEFRRGPDRPGQTAVRGGARTGGQGRDRQGSRGPGRSAGERPVVRGGRRLDGPRDGRQPDPGRRREPRVPALGKAGLMARAISATARSWPQT